MSKLLVDLPDSIRKRAEILAADGGVSVDQFLAAALSRLGNDIMLPDSSVFSVIRLFRG